MKFNYKLWIILSVSLLCCATIAPKATSITNIGNSYVNFDEQPLHVLYQSGTLTQLRNEEIVKGDLKVELRAFPFEENPDFGNMPKPSDDVDCSACIMHVYSTPEGGYLFKQRLYSYEEIGVLGDDIYLMGHYHLDQGVKVVNNIGKDQHFINVGALSRGALSEDNIKRSPKICLVTIQKDQGEVSIKTQQIRLKVKPAEEIFDLEKKEREKEKIKEAEEFVDKLKENISEDNSEKATIESEVSKLDVEKKVLKKVNSLLSEASLQIREVVK